MPLHNSAQPLIVEQKRIFAKLRLSDAELEINISGRLRDTFVHLDQANYEGMELEQFVTVYDELISEMMKYQAESYQRFERANGH